MNDNSPSGEVWEGGCLCGKVRYRAAGKLAEVLACHCRQCRRMSGHVFAATAVRREAFQLTKSDGLAWYNSSANSRRGFCRECGSSLFFDHGEVYPMGVAAGSFDKDPPFKLTAHIYTDEAGAYYDLGDGAEVYDAAAWSRGGWQKYRPG